MDCNVLQAFSKRHSFYNINNKLDLSEHDVEELIRGCLELYPSSFNSQDARLILLMGEHHKYFWELVKKELFRVSEITKKEQIEQKIGFFAVDFLLFDAEKIFSHHRLLVVVFTPLAYKRRGRGIKLALGGNK